MKFYQINEPEIKPSTLNWRTYNLVKQGVLTRLGRGKFRVGTTSKYTPEIPNIIYSLNKELVKKFPFLSICFWSTSVLNEFMIHQPGNFYIIAEVERDSLESVFYFLKENKHSVFLEPNEDIIYRYIHAEKNAIIIIPLITESPVQKVKGVNTITIEKMLVDIFCEKDIFAAQQGAELRNIFIEAFNKYTINKNRLLRYADRRRRKKDIIKYLESIFNPTF